MRRYYFDVVAFVSGAVVMVLELTGSRILAPYVGSSIFIWSSLIGIVLASLSLGYYFGGKLADKNSSLNTLAAITFWSGVAIGLTAICETQLLLFLSQRINDIRAIALISSLVLFGPASLALGMLVPYLVKLKLRSLKKTGETAGRLYALSTAGSIFGTFLAGFYLISVMGSRNILFFLSGTMFLLSLLNPKIRKATFFVIFFLLLTYFILPPVTAYVLDKDTSFYRIVLEENLDPATSRPILVLKTGLTKQSAMFLDKDDELVHDYTKYFRIAKHFNPNLKRTLALGGGAFSYPKDFLKRNPNGKIDVVELDPGTVEIAKKYFKLPNDPRLSVINADARVFLNKNTKLYDAIFFDVYAGDVSIPFHLTTQEAVSLLYSSLNDNGVVVANIGSVFDSEKGSFLWAEYATYKESFPYVYLFGVKDPKDDQRLQNIMLVAVKTDREPSLTSKNPEFSEYLDHLYTGEAPEAPVLTDDFAPVEQYNLAIQKWRY